MLILIQIGVNAGVNFGQILYHFGCILGVQKGSQDDTPKMVQKYTPKVRFGTHLGDQVGPKLGTFWHLKQQKVTFLHLKLQSKNVLKLSGLLDASWGRFWNDFGSQNGSKMGPKRELAKYAKTLKNHWFFNDFGVSGGSKMSQKSVPRWLQDRMPT